MAATKPSRALRAAAERLRGRTALRNQYDADWSFDRWGRPYAAENRLAWQTVRGLLRRGLARLVLRPTPATLYCALVAPGEVRETDRVIPPERYREFLSY